MTAVIFSMAVSSFAGGARGFADRAPKTPCNLLGWCYNRPPVSYIIER